ncbi:phosphatase PAP2 family protein [Bacillus tuaregi]|uniref:phosphatase PAP2 family protein n=1 Tax=Bacillus tuaregi TaxID=1816695 RepID=UPI0008F87918|nr:phosphatase PAP2 family protein [Bacillus tuaregi]
METYVRSGKKLQYLGVAALLLLLFLYGFIKMSQQLSGFDIQVFDHQMIAYIQSAISPQLTALMLVITFLGSVGWITFIVVVLVIVFLVKKKRALALFFAASSGIGALFNMLLKWLFKRERPDILPLISEEGYSFPSGHSMGSLIFYGSLAYVLLHLVTKKSLQTAIVIVNSMTILFIGLSRIYLGVHYPSDIVGGFLAGGVWLLFCIILFRYYEYRHDL